MRERERERESQAPGPALVQEPVRERVFVEDGYGGRPEEEGEVTRHEILLGDRHSLRQVKRMTSPLLAYTHTPWFFEGRFDPSSRASSCSCRSASRRKASIVQKISLKAKDTCHKPTM